jgi:SET domain-containing protein
MTTTSKPSKTKSVPYEVRRSTIHGNGVFATRDIEPGEQIDEYTGERISADESALRAEAGGGPVNHTFFFSLADGRVIDGGSRGNDARFINHSCEPNCEAQEDEGRVYIHALHPIAKGEELNYNYALIYEERHTPAVKKAFECRCGAPGCTGTMLAPKKRKRSVANKA